MTIIDRSRSCKLHLERKKKFFMKYVIYIYKSLFCQYINVLALCECVSCLCLCASVYTLLFTALKKLNEHFCRQKNEKHTISYMYLNRLDHNSNKANI